MPFNFSTPQGRRSLFKSLGLVALFGAVLSLVLVVSRPSDSQNSNPPMSNSSELLADASTPVDCLTATSASTVRPDDVSQILLGTNLAAVADWSTQLPFLDGFKSARAWMTQCDASEPGCSGGWDTPERDLLDLDERGWVKSLPAPEDPPEYTRAGTLLFREIEGRYPGGQYVVLYQGEGEIRYGFDAQKDEAASRPGRDIINVTPSDSGILLQITATDPNQTGNYIRDIHVVPIEFEDTFQTEIFNPVFLERLQGFRAIRFMDWMKTNDSEQKDWAGRPQVDDATYATEKGVPLEVMIALVNRLGVTPWFNMPHQSTDEYMAQFANTVKTCLNPNLKAYVELSNEVWNWQFKQAHYALEQGKGRWGQDKGDAFMQWYGMRAAQMSDIWKQVFADQPDRVISVMATQTAWQGLENAALDCPLWVEEGNAPCYQHGFDTYAITGYFSGKLSDGQHSSIIESWLSDPDGGFDKAIRQIRQGDLISGGDFDDTLPGVRNWLQYHRQVAQERGLRLIAYEGGQHLVSSGNEKLTDFFIALNRHPEMYNLYSELLQNWQDAGGTLFMHFSDVGKPSKWGSWGALEAVDQPSSPKYDALMNFIDRL